jgi:uncharacterized coiled-coil protein SlyX
VRQDAADPGLFLLARRNIRFVRVSLRPIQIRWWHSKQWNADHQLNEFLKAHRTVQEQKATIAQLKFTDAKQEATIAKQQKQIEALTAGLQKVSAQIEASKPAPQVVSNP